MLNKTYKKLIDKSQEDLKKILLTKFGEDYCQLTFDSYIQDGPHNILLKKNIIIMDPCLGELEELKNNSQFDPSHHEFISPSKALKEFIEKNLNFSVSTLTVKATSFPLENNPEFKCLGFRGFKHPYAGLEIFTGTVLAIEKRLEKRIPVHIDLTDVLEDSLPYNQETSTYYNLRKAEINWNKQQQELLKKMNVQSSLFPSHLFLPAYGFICGFDHFLSSFGSSGGKIITSRNILREELKASFIDPRIFHNYEWGDIDSLINKYIYEILAEDIIKTCNF